MSLPEAKIHATLSSANDEESIKQFHHLGNFLKTVKHYFGSFERLFSSIRDPRNPKLITYPLYSLFLSVC
jgi:hypothetical protein